MSGLSHTASRTGDTALLLLWERPGITHAREVAETLRREGVGEVIVSVEPASGESKRTAYWNATYRQTTPEEIALAVLGSSDDTHAYRAVIEAVKLARS